MLAWQQNRYPVFAPISAEADDGCTQPFPTRTRPIARCYRGLVSRYLLPGLHEASGQSSPVPASSAFFSRARAPVVRVRSNRDPMGTTNQMVTTSR